MSAPAARDDAPRPCVFLDRDGTVSREAGYINHPDRIELLPGSAAAIRKLNARGALAILATNQAGVARGYFTEETLGLIHGRLVEQLAARGARLDALYYSPFHSSSKDERYRKDDGTRKPGIGMIDRARAEFAVDMGLSYVVGDKITDVEMARNAGIKGVFVLSGYGLGDYEFNRASWPCEPDHVAKDLPEAVAWILKDMRAIERARAREAKSAPKSAAHAPSGPAPWPSPRETALKIMDLPAARAWIDRRKTDGARVVFANGCFDLIHGGHVSYLEGARAAGDALIVGINSDASERALKGPGRPVVREADRAELVAGIGAVDAVVLFEETTCERLLRELRPHAHAKGTDYTLQTVPEREIARELGIEVVIAGAPKENNSKDIIRAAAGK